MSPKMIFIVILLTAMPVVSIYEASAEDKSTKFFNSFILEELVRKSESPWGRLCAQGGRSEGGGGGVRGTTRGVHFYKTETFSCRIEMEENGEFNRNALLDSLRSDVEKQIVRSGAWIVRRGGIGPAGFYFGYRKGGIRGRVEITGSMVEGHYSLSAKLDEKAGLKR